MNLRPLPIAAGVTASERCIVRGHRLVQVKFVALPMDCHQAYVRPRSPISSIIRAIGRLVAARP